MVRPRHHVIAFMIVSSLFLCVGFPVPLVAGLVFLSVCRLKTGRFTG